MISVAKQNFVLYIKSVIFKYCPYMEDRLYILGNSQSPQLDIEFSIHNNETYITFIFGTKNSKIIIPEQAICSYTIEPEEICEIIDFILEDHEIIKDINYRNMDLDLKFAIDWSDKSVNGINVGDIGLNLNFENLELKKKYLYLIFQKYYTQLEQTESFKKIKNGYIDSIKHNYLETMDKNQLIALLSEMSEGELKELLHNLDNDVFVKYTMGSSGLSKTRV